MGAATIAMTNQELHALAIEWASGIPFRKIEVQSADVVAIAAAYLRQEAALQQMDDAAEMLWVVVANVSGGDWAHQTVEWQIAAARWRDNYFAIREAALAQESER